MKNKKVYVLMVSKYFPAYHVRAGQETLFKEKIYASIHPNLAAVGTQEHPIKYPIKFHFNLEPKIHTIRGSYELWAARAEKINRGEAVLSLRQWSGKPYRSKQEEFLRLERISVQRIRCGWMHGLEGGTKQVKFLAFDLDGHGIFSRAILAKNDGLEFKDFCDWFREPFSDGVIIHFTENFKY